MCQVPVCKLCRTCNTYILLHVLLCSIAEYFYELCRILASPWGESKCKQRVKIGMFVRANFVDIYLQGMRDKTMRSGTELTREIKLTDWSMA